MVQQFKKAEKFQAKLRMCIVGPSGSGKTWTALAIAKHMGAGRTALIDTEHESSLKYADIYDFDALILKPPFHPENYVAAIKQAAEQGFQMLIIDSLSHAWAGPGGLLEVVDQIAAGMQTTNTFAAWRKGTPIQNALVESILDAPMHVIATMRSKQEYAMERDEQSGKNAVRKLGLAPIQRDNFEYEFDVFAMMTMDNQLVISKTRCPPLTGTGGLFDKPTGEEIAGIITEWLSGKVKPHWADDPDTVTQFWTIIGEKLAIDEKELLELVGIKSLQDWGDSANNLFKEAKAKLEAKLLAEE